MKVKAAPNDDMVWIAQKAGRRNWKAIYDHADNDSLKKKRDDPHVLQEGDEVVIPPVEPKEHDAHTNKEFVFILPTPKVYVRLRLYDTDDAPYADKRFVLTVGNDKYPGTTKPDGLVEALVSLTARTAELYLILTEESEEEDEDGIIFEIQLARLDPAESIAGAQHRLANLGYEIDDPPGELGVSTRSAIISFQIDQEIPSDELPEDATKLDAKTAERLEKIHGS